MTPPKFSTVLFDADGVMSDGTWLSLEKDYGIPQETSTQFFDGGYKDCLVGKADMKEVLASYLQEWQWKGSVDDFCNYWLTRCKTAYLSSYAAHRHTKMT